MYKLKIKITKEILKRSMYCTKNESTSNCAIAVAIKEVFPTAVVGHSNIFFNYPTTLYGSSLPKEARDFIKKFDNLYFKNRLELPEIEFEIEIPDEIIQKINIDELMTVLENHPHLKLESL